MKQRLQQGVMIRAVLVVALSVFSTSAFAYLDPSTGSMVVSAVVGVFASIALALKTYWYKLKKLVRRANKRRGAGGRDSPGQE